MPGGRPWELPERYRSVGQPVLVPGDMGRYSFVLAGTEGAMSETFGSSAYGAGIGKKVARLGPLIVVKGRGDGGSFGDREDAGQRLGERLSGCTDEDSSDVRRGWRRAARVRQRDQHDCLGTEEVTDERARGQVFGGSGGARRNPGYSRGRPGGRGLRPPLRFRPA